MSRAVVGASVVCSRRGGHFRAVVGAPWWARRGGHFRAVVGTFAGKFIARPAVNLTREL